MNNTRLYVLEGKLATSCGETMSQYRPAPKWHTKDQ